MKPEPLAERVPLRPAAPVTLMFTTPDSTARMSGAREPGGTKPGSIGSFEVHSRHSPGAPPDERAESSVQVACSPARAASQVSREPGAAPAAEASNHRNSPARGMIGQKGREFRTGTMASATPSTLPAK